MVEDIYEVPRHACHSHVSRRQTHYKGPSRLVVPVINRKWVTKRQNANSKQILVNSREELGTKGGENFSSLPRLSRHGGVGWGTCLPMTGHITPGLPVHAPLLDWLRRNLPGRPTYLRFYCGEGKVEIKWQFRLLKTMWSIVVSDRV